MSTSKPSPTPLSHGQRYVDEQREAVDGFGRRGNPGTAAPDTETAPTAVENGDKTRSRRENGTDQRYRQDRSPRRRSDPQHDADTVLVGWRSQSATGTLSSAISSIRSRPRPPATYSSNGSRGHDLTLVGATHERVLRRFVFGAIPEEVGRRAENTVTMPKRDLGITSRLRRRFGRG